MGKSENLINIANCPEFIKKVWITWITSGHETLEVFMYTFSWLFSFKRRTYGRLRLLFTNSNPITSERLLLAVKSFGPFESPGPNDIIWVYQHNAKIINVIQMYMVLYTKPVEQLETEGMQSYTPVLLSLKSTVKDRISADDNAYSNTIFHISTYIFQRQIG